MHRNLVNVDNETWLAATASSSSHRRHSSVPGLSSFHCHFLPSARWTTDGRSLSCFHYLLCWPADLFRGAHLNKWYRLRARPWCYFWPGHAIGRAAPVLPTSGGQNRYSPFLPPLPPTSYNYRVQCTFRLSTIYDRQVITSMQWNYLSLWNMSVCLSIRFCGTDNPEVIGR